MSNDNSKRNEDPDQAKTLRTGGADDSQGLNEDTNSDASLDKTAQYSDERYGSDIDNTQSPYSDRTRKPFANQTFKLDSQDALESFIGKGPGSDNSADEELGKGTLQSSTIDDAEALDDQQIPGFEIINEIGRGAFGIVYRAIDIKLDRHVAIKIPLLQDPKLGEKYIKEARNAAKIDTVGIVPVLQVGATSSGQPFVVQKLIEGNTLRTVIKDKGKLAVGNAVEYTHRIATAISEAHAAGLVHRDLKPANILIDGVNEPWVADFGLSVFEEEQRELRGEIAGTPMYMSPEQLKGRADWLDGRADIWSIGIIFYEMLTGKAPFDAKGFHQIKEQILNRSPRPISQRIAEAPAQLDEIFNRCCAKDVQDRYRNARELADDLQNLLLTGNLEFADTIVAGRAEGANPRTRRNAASTVIGRSMYGSVAVPKSKSSLGTWVLTSAIVCLAILGAVGFGIMWNRLNKATVLPSPPAPDLVDAPPADPGSTQFASESPRLDRVSKIEENASRSVAEAVAAAKAGDTITLTSGQYSESIIIDKPLTLIGEDARDNVRLVGNQGPALRIVDGAIVTLKNFVIDANGNEINTIEIEDGKLIVEGCQLIASSYDCINVHPGTALTAKGTDFVSAENPAIVAKSASDLRIETCHFRFQLPNAVPDRDAPIGGIQLTDCGGTIKGCTFTGIDRLGKGISSGKSTTPLIIAGCTFNGLLHGVELFECSNVELIALNIFSACDIAFYAQASEGSLNDLEIKASTYAIVLQETSHFAISSLICERNIHGVWIQNAHVDMQQCSILNSQVVGMLIDGGSAAEPNTLNACTVQENSIGLLLASGRIELDGGLISQNTKAGILVQNQLPEHLRKEGNAAENREIYAAGTKINAKGEEGPAILFNSTGSYELKDAAIVDTFNYNLPTYNGNLTTRVGAEITQVLEAQSGSD